MFNIKKSINLSLTLAKYDFKLRNEGSYLGILWYLLNPLLLFTLLLLIFSDRLGNNIPFYPIYLLTGIIIFNFFQSATIESTKAIDENRWLIKSIYFPREVLILSIIFRTLFSHLFEIILLMAFLIWFNVPLYGILFYPLIIIFLALFTYGIGLFVSIIKVYITDFENIWIFLTKLLWFVTPIFYEISGQSRLFLLNLFNPLYYFITLSRDLIIYSKIPEPFIILGVITYTLLALVIGLIFFAKLKGKIGENI